MRTRDKRMLENAVKRGTAYLDANPDKEEAFEEWYRIVNLNHLQMSSVSYCIIGQTLGNYSKLVDVDDFGSWSDEKLNRWATRHGFLVQDREVTVTGYAHPFKETNYRWRDDAYAYLTELWRDAIEERLAQDLAQSLSDSLTGPSPA